MFEAVATGSSGRTRSRFLTAPSVLIPTLMLALVVAVHYVTQRMVMLALLAPLLEESIFRAGLQESLLRRWYSRPHMVNALTATAFALAHVALRADAAAIAVALPALLIGAVYQRTGRLRHCVLLHAALNTIWMVWTLTGGPHPGVH